MDGNEYNEDDVVACGSELELMIPKNGLQSGLMNFTIEATVFSFWFKNGVMECGNNGMLSIFALAA